MICGKKVVKLRSASSTVLKILQYLTILFEDTTLMNHIK